MLSQILRLFEESSEALCVDEIAQRLEADPAAVEAMLDLLVQMDRLVEVGGMELCSSCPTRAACYLIPAARRTFLPVEKSAWPQDEPG